jgi:hypothetical protein
MIVFVRFFSMQLLEVNHQTVAVCEAMLIHAQETLVWFFASMLPNMRLHRTAVSEGAATVFALVGLLTTVCAQMNLQGTLLRKTVLAELATIRKLPFMPAPMHFQSMLPGKRSGAQITLVWFHVEMSCKMAHGNMLLSESLATHTAQEFLPLFVHL